MDDKALGDLFFFDEFDLNDNRNGRLSENQKKKMEDVNRGGRNIGIGIAVFCFVVALIWPFIAVILAKGTLGTGGAIWMVIWGLLGCYCLYSVLFNKSDSISKIVIKRIEGPVHFVAMDAGSGGEIEYAIHVGREKLDVVDDACRQIMKEGDTYTVYFYKLNDGTGNHILSLEGFTKK